MVSAGIPLFFPFHTDNAVCLNVSVCSIHKDIYILRASERLESLSFGWKWLKTTKWSKSSQIKPTLLMTVSEYALAAWKLATVCGSCRGQTVSSCKMHNMVCLNQVSNQLTWFGGPDREKNKSPYTRLKHKITQISSFSYFSSEDELKTTVARPVVPICAATHFINNHICPNSGRMMRFNPSVWKSDQSNFTSVDSATCKQVMLYLHD